MILWFALGVALPLTAAVTPGARWAQQPPPPCVVPSPPSNLAADTSAKGTTLTWTASASGTPTEYAVEYGNVPGGVYMGTYVTTGPELSQTRELTPGAYYIRVRARSACGTSEPSPEIRAEINLNHVAPPTVPDVVIARRGSDRNPYFPTAEVLKNGDIIVVYYDSPDHVSPAGRISMVRSRDQGRTWSAPTVVFDGPGDERDPNVMQTSTGTLLLTYFESVPTDPYMGGVYLIRSDDDGRTWSSPMKVDTLLKGTATSSKIVELDNGDLLMPLYGIIAIGEHASVSIVRSSDGGRTWPREREQLITIDRHRDFVEPALANLGDGRVLAMIRSEPMPYLAYESYSVDGGRTWSVPTLTDVSGQGPDLLALTGGPDAVVVHTWGDWSRRFGASRPTLMQVIRFEGFPRVARAERMRLLYRGNCFDDEAYPSSVRLADGRILTVYYDVCQGYVGGSFSVVPATAPPAAATVCPATAPPPRNLRLVYNRERVVTMAWDGNLKAPDSYILQASVTPGGSDLLDLDMGQMTSFSRPLVASGTYYVQVRAKNACGVGRRSNQLTVVVP